MRHVLFVTLTIAYPNIGRPLCQLPHHLFQFHAYKHLSNYTILPRIDYYFSFGRQHVTL